MQEFIDKYYKKFADNVKRLRQEQGLSQEEFAERIGCSREYISRVENHREKIGLTKLLQIAYLFNTPPESLFFN